MYLEWLREQQIKYRDECCTQPPEKVLRPQGKVEVVNDIFKAFEEAPGVTEKFKSQRR